MQICRLQSAKRTIKQQLSYPHHMATTPTPISAANLPFHTTLKPLSPPFSPSFVLKCSNPRSINGIRHTKSLNTSKNGALVDEDDIVETERKLMKKKEKLESVKAASISAIVGTFASLPISLTHVTNTYEQTVSTVITVITCALYGATYRYTIRRDVDDFHLKTGTSAAFGIVKGVATLDGQTSLDALSGGICVSENVIIFLLAAAGLDICYKMGILSPFPLETRT